MTFFSQLLAEDTKPTDKEQPLVISVMTNSPPFSMLLPNGQPTGLNIEFWQLWSKTNHIPITFILNDFKQNIKLLKENKVNFDAGLTLTDERKEWADFSQPLYELRSGLFFLAAEDVFSIDKLNGKTIGVGSGTFQESYLKKHYPYINISAFSDADKTIQALLDSKIDAIFSEVPFLQARLGKMGLREIFILSPERITENTIHALILKGNSKLVKIINDGIKNIPRNKLIALEEKWLPNVTPFHSKHFQSNLPLSTKEIDWLNTQDSFSLGVDSSSPPIEFINDNNEFSGISSGYIELIKSKLKVNFFNQSGLGWSELIERIKQGSIDILPAIVATPERDKFINFTKPYVTFPVVIVTNINGVFISNLKDVEQFKVGVVRHYFIEELLTTNHPKIKLQYFSDTRSALDKVNSGEIDVFIHDLATVTHEINSRDFNNVRISATTPYNLELSIGVRKGLEPLIPILNQIIDNIDSKERTRIANDWLALKFNIGISITTFLLWSSPILAFLSLFIAYVNLSNKRLKREAIQRQALTDSLEEARQAAENANRAKDYFLANMSHELRTPLNAVLGLTHLLNDSKLDAEQSNYLHLMSNSADTLLKLVDDILDLSKIEAGKLNIESMSINLVELIHDLESQIRIKIANKDIDLNVYIDKNVPSIIIGDPLRLSQILNNLCSNAVKFTEKGDINIKVILLTQPKPETFKLQFSVSDTGIGLTEVQQGRLFKTYSQADSSTTRKYGGTGLGLAICKKLCQMMQGEIWVESEINIGSTFYFTVEFQQFQSTANDNDNEKAKPIYPNVSIDSAIDVEQLKSKKILIVDDNKVNLTIAEKILTRVGVIVSTAEDGKEAIKLLEQALNSEPFDAVLMDIQMPVMDGYEASAIIRQHPEMNALPIIALSANVMESDVQKSLDIGMNAHISKPIRVNKLLSTLIEHLN